MTHDPLCDSLTDDGLFVAYGGPAGGADHIYCLTCEAIRKVREDEAELHGYRLHDPAYAKGYAAALRDAKAAVERAYEKDSPTVQQGTAHGVTLALHAIEALQPAERARIVPQVDTPQSKQIEHINLATGQSADSESDKSPYDGQWHRDLYGGAS